MLQNDQKRQLTEEMRQNEVIQQHKKKLDSEYLNQLAWRNAQQADMNKTLSRQLSEKRNNDKLGNQLYTIESTKVKQKEQEVNHLENHIKNEKKERQQIYKDLLRSQIEFNKHIKMQGNMTAVEKQLNRADLKAFKNNDKNVYSFIPGINHSNFGSKNNFYSKSAKKAEDEAERLRRLEAMGYSRRFDGRMINRHKHNNSISILPDMGTIDHSSREANLTFEHYPSSENLRNQGVHSVQNSPYNHHKRRSKYF